MNMHEQMMREARRSDPDLIAYVPGHYDGSTNDTLNEHFLAFDGPDGSLMAVWTQSDRKNEGGARNNRCMFSQSFDNGASWTTPMLAAGPRDRNDKERMASWAYPMVSSRGRIYVLFTRNEYGVAAWIGMHTGWTFGVYSDDNGQTWSQPKRVELPANPYNDPDGIVPPETLVWQNGMKDKQGRYLFCYTRWFNPKTARVKSWDACAGDWTMLESACEVIRFENLDENPEPDALIVSGLAYGKSALRVPHWRDPLISVAQEPSFVRLPDDRIFMAMRTNAGYIWYSISMDDGNTWCNPRPLLRRDHGEPILQPLICCPLYRLSDGRYVLMHHNHRGFIDMTPPNTANPRRPAFIALGEYRPNADQPIWFSDSKVFADNGGYAIDGSQFDIATPEKQRQWNDNIGVYGSFSSRNGDDVIWHADRKSFLVGKRVSREMLADLIVPKE